MKKNRVIDQQITEYFDYVLQGALIFREGIKYYVRGDNDLFIERMKRLDTTESQGDRSRRLIEITIYQTRKLQEDRGDMLGLIENSDKILNQMSLFLIEMDIQKPFIPDEIKEWFIGQSQQAALAVEHMVSGIRSFFAGCGQCQHHIEAVMCAEKETDRVGMLIRRWLANSTIHLSMKNHIRFFVAQMEGIADRAEDVCDRLTIATIKKQT